MGKIKNRRQRSNRYNPVASTNETRNGNSSQTSTSSRAGLKSVSEKISSPAVEVRIVGLNTLAAIACDEENAKETIGQVGLISSVANLLLDANVEVKVAAAGALRNISGCCSDEVIDAMIQENILPPLMQVILRFDDWLPSVMVSSEGGKEDTETMLFLQSTYLLLNLCEVSEEAVSSFNQEGLIKILIKHLHLSTSCKSVALACAECLLCISENNTSAASNLLLIASELMLLATNVVADDSFSLRFATTILGVLININFCTSDVNFPIVMNMLSCVLSKDVTQIVTNYITDEQISSHDIEHLIFAQQLSLEILGNICCPEEEDEDSVDLMMGDELSEAEDEINSAMETTTSETFVLTVSSQVQEAIMGHQLLQKILDKLNFLSEEVITELVTRKDGNSLLKRLSTLRIRALLCLQNLSGCIDLNATVGTELMFSTWSNLGVLVFQNNSTDGTLLEATTGAMCAIMNQLSKSCCEKLANLSQADLQVIFSAGITCTVPHVRSNLARMCGTIGCHLVKKSEEPLIQQKPVVLVLCAISEYLLKVASHDTELWVCAEALDVLIDLFSDDKTDLVAGHVHLVERLRGIGPVFKSMFQQQKQMLKEHRPLVITVRDNLPNFIKYKTPRVKLYLIKPNKII